MTGPMWSTKPLGQPEQPGHFSRMPQPVVLQPGSIERGTNQLRPPDSSVGRLPAIPAGADVGGLLGKWARSIWKSHMGTGHLVSDLAAAPETVAGRLTRARKGLGCVSHRAGLRGCGPLVSEDLMTLPPVISERFTGWRDVSPENIERLTSVDTPAAKQSGSCFRIVVPGGNNPRDVDAGCCPLRPCDGNAQRTQPRSKRPPQSFRTLAANPCQRPVDARGGNPME